MGKSGSLLKLNLTPFFIFFHNCQAPTLLHVPPVTHLRNQCTEKPTTPYLPTGRRFRPQKPQHLCRSSTPQPYLLGTMELKATLYPPFSSYFLTYLELPCSLQKSHSVNGKYFYIFVCLCITSSVMTYELNLACIWRRDIHPVWMKLSKYLQRLFGPYLVQ